MKHNPVIIHCIYIYFSSHTDLTSSNGLLVWLRNTRVAWRRSSSYLGQLLSDPLKVLRAPRVEADGAARVHLAERHLLRRGAVIGLVRRGRHKSLFENTRNLAGAPNLVAVEWDASPPRFLTNENLIYLPPRRPWIRSAEVSRGISWRAKASSKVAIRCRELLFDAQVLKYWGWRWRARRAPYFSGVAASHIRAANKSAGSDCVIGPRAALTFIPLSTNRNY